MSRTVGEFGTCRIDLLIGVYDTIVMQYILYACPLFSEVYSYTCPGVFHVK